LTIQEKDNLVPAQPDGILQRLRDQLDVVDIRVHAEGAKDRRHVQKTVQTDGMCPGQSDLYFSLEAQCAVSLGLFATFRLAVKALMGQTLNLIRPVHKQQRK
jgi:hypothetical protein